MIICKTVTAKRKKNRFSILLLPQHTRAHMHARAHTGEFPVLQYEQLLHSSTTALHLRAFSGDNWQPFPFLHSIKPLEEI